MSLIVAPFDPLKRSARGTSFDNCGTGLMDDSVIRELSVHVGEGKQPSGEYGEEYESNDGHIDAPILEVLYLVDTLAGWRLCPRILGIH